MRGRTNRHALVEVDAVVEQVLVVRPGAARACPALVPQPLDSGDVVRLVQGEVNRAVPVESDPVIGLREVLAAEPEVDGVVGEDLEGHVRRCEPCPSGRLAVDLLAVGLAEHLDATERELPIVRSQVPVVERQGLLELRGVGLLGHCHQRQVVVPHVVTAHNVGAVCQAVRMRLVGRAQQQHGGVHGAAGDDDDVRR